MDLDPIKFIAVLPLLAYVCIGTYYLIAFMPGIDANFEGRAAWIEYARVFFLWFLVVDSRSSWVPSTCDRCQKVLDHSNVEIQTDGWIKLHCLCGRKQMIPPTQPPTKG